MLLKETSQGIILPVKVVPKAARHQMCGWEGEELKIRLRAIPEKGKANEALIAFIAEELDLSPSQITLTAGETSRHKRLLITHISREECDKRLDTAIRSSSRR
jgi:uncharacterized protein (TIGR00251 family)